MSPQPAQPESVSRTLTLAQCLTSVVNQSIFKRFILTPKVKKYTMTGIVHYILYVLWQDTIAENKRCRSGFDENRELGQSSPQILERDV